MANVDQLTDMLVTLVRGGAAPEAAAAQLAQFAPADEVDEAVRRFQGLTGRIRTLRDPRAIVSPDLTGWYTGSKDGDVFWPRLKTLLIDGGFTEDELASLNRASDRVLSLMAPPGQPRIRTRGLVLGHVQAGKTANYTAVMAKAADVNYRFFIVLTGMLENLRRQTQIRLNDQLVALDDELWYPLTDETRDFRDPGGANAFLSERHELRILAVVKKNSRRLEMLLEWLRSAREEILRNCPIVVIDDEADQASVNASRYDDQRTRINRLIVDTLEELPKAAYVAYTATPFANVLVDPTDLEDIYPRDFIVDLPKPPRHFGPESIFGREPVDEDEDSSNLDGLDMVREVPVKELPDLKEGSRDTRHEFYPSVTETLGEALDYFVLATAARRARGQDAHSTMLVHTSVYTDVHARFQPLLQAHFRQLADAHVRGDGTARLRDVWDRESSKPGVTAEDMGEVPVSWDELESQLAGVLADVEVLIDNAQSFRRLEYAPDAPKVCVVIGGNTLSRGLTLEGLVVSYFVRAAGAYDTLLQMGRWFGYRPGYSDLPRIWMTAELDQLFRDLARVEAEIRYDIRRYELEGITPQQFAVRIRTHPKLSVTSRMKMRHAVPVSASYDGRRLQTIMFAHRNQDWLRSNLRAGEHLIERAIAENPPVELAGRWLLENLDVGPIFDFLDTYAFHERSVELKSNLLQGYIEAQNRREALLRWNVVIVGRRSGAPMGRLGLGLPETVPLLNRAKMKRSADGTYADIKALMSKIDRVADFREITDAHRAMSDEELGRQRPRGTGLLLLYPVSKDSTPRGDGGESAHRAPLDAVEHVLGVGLVFPETDEDSPQEYIAAPLPKEWQEDAEWEAEWEAELGVEPGTAANAG